MKEFKALKFEVVQEVTETTLNSLHVTYNKLINTKKNIAINIILLIELIVKYSNTGGFVIAMLITLRFMYVNIVNCFYC